ncbi:hypothetical protein F5X98DRAFT_391430 [Xylaria grammica]|nr:hypothetical protein F5X98DRAFT_391430 [Xylaria grammica]
MAEPNPSEAEAADPWALPEDLRGPELDEAQKARLETYLAGLDYGDPRAREARTINRIPWSQASRFRRFEAAREIGAHATGDPASQTREASEPCRQLWVAQAAERDGWAVEKEAVMARLAPDALTRDNPADRLLATQFPPTDKYQAARGTGIYTFGVKLNPLIAHTWVSTAESPTAADGKPFPPGDPHPDNPAPVVDHELSAAQVASDVAMCLNATGKVIATVKDELERQPARIIEELIVKVMGLGHSYVEAHEHVLDWANELWWDEDEQPYNTLRELPQSPSRPPRPFQFNNPELADEAVNELAGMITRIATAGRNVTPSIRDLPPELLVDVDLNTYLLQKPVVNVFAGITTEQIKRSVKGIPALLQRVRGTNSFTPAELSEIQKRTEYAVRARVLGAQVDPLAFANLPLVKARYLTWSVSEDPNVDLQYVQSSQYRRCPDPEATRPVDMYRWVRLEVSSPIFQEHHRPEPDEVRGSLEVVCDTLRTQLRTHHCALPTLDGTTSVFIGHTEGFTLLELKKMATLWIVVEPMLRCIHRARRDTAEGQAGCRPFLLGTRLGQLCIQPLDQPLDDPDRIMPHPSPEQREFARWQMHDHIACRTLFGEIPPHHELFIRAIWMYTSVSELARALESARKPECTSLAMRCYGSGQRTSRQRSSRETRARIDGRDGPYTYPPDIDEHRGVLEFRMMGPSLDADHIMGWVHICGKLVRLARETNGVTFRELVGLFRDPELSDTASPWDVLWTTQKVREVFGTSNRDREQYYRPRRDGTVDYNYPFYAQPGQPAQPERPARRRSRRGAASGQPSS